MAADGTIVDRREAALQTEGIVSEIADIVSQLRASTPNVRAIGLAVPGLVNPRNKQVVVSSDLSAAVSAGIHDELAAATGLRVELGNDANAGAYGEFKAGAGRGSRDMFYVTIGAGVGGALILGGKLWLGASGYAGEFGHITIDAEGIECICGNTGCLETVASAPNIVRRAKDRLYRDSTSSLSKLAIDKDFTAADVAHEAMNGDDFALMMIERTGKFIGAAIASVINLLNIERIVLGGSVAEAGDLILNPIIREAERRAFQPCFESTQIVAAQLGVDAIPLGAAMLARDEEAALPE